MMPLPTSLVNLIRAPGTLDRWLKLSLFWLLSRRMCLRVSGGGTGAWRDPLRSTKLGDLFKWLGLLEE